MKRRDALKALGLSLGASAISVNSWANTSDNLHEYIYPDTSNLKSLTKPVTAITIGAGSRGNVYSNYAIKFPEQLNIIGVAEPQQSRQDKFKKKHNLSAENIFNTWEDVFKKPKFADAVIISTPDYLHYAPCMKALEMGYDILLEKPIAPTEKECRNILKKTKETGQIVAVCHVLRYAPYFVKMRELLSQGAIGKVVSMQHFEPIEYAHMAHSYVRGNWHNSKKTSPIILAKSCHDLDIMRWVLNKPAKKIAAFGDLKWFKNENAPEGSTKRCTDGCKIEQECPYSAINIYKERKKHLNVFDISKKDPNFDKLILEKLKTTNYGRCVYHMDNDQPDHYVTSIEFGDNVTANFSMEAFTSYGGRRTRIMGTMGDMVGDMKELVVNNFRSGKKTKFIPKAEEIEEYKNSGHGGGDWMLLRDFIQAVGHQDPSYLTSSISESIESHVMGFKAEDSRLKGKIVDINI